VFCLPDGNEHSLTTSKRVINTIMLKNVFPASQEGSASLVQRPAEFTSLLGESIRTQIVWTRLEIFNAKTSGKHPDGYFLNIHSITYLLTP
jgi:hypothetical protein